MSAQPPVRPTFLKRTTMISRRTLWGHLLALVTAAAMAAPALGQNTMLRWQTSMGPIDIQLYDTAAPKTVANFLGYVRSGAYVNSFFHRSVPNFVVQGGGFTWASANSGVQTIAAGAPVVNEFSATRSNLRGTVAMAKLGSGPDTATCQWFVNLANNAGNLDNQNGGFTVFGRVTTSGMAVFDQIAALRTVDAGGAFTNLPVVNLTGNTVLLDNVVRASSVTLLPGVGAASDSDRLFNYLEARYPQYLPLAGASAGTGLGYYYRYYPASGAYVGTQNGNVAYLVPAIDGEIHQLGSLAEWLAVAAGEGY
jgi:peptidyl-prolyl cis-trans isomerase A (cyclophilin A)